MKSKDGTYISSVEPEAWEPDTEIGGWAHMLFDHGETKAGLWKADPDIVGSPVEVEIPARETIVVLQGGVRVAIDRGDAHALGVGEMISIPEMSLVGWDPSPDCKVFWVYS